MFGSATALIAKPAAIYVKAYLMAALKNNVWEGILTRYAHFLEACRSWESYGASRGVQALVVGQRDVRLVHHMRMVTWG